MPTQEDVFAVLEDVLPHLCRVPGKYDTATSAPSMLSLTLQGHARSRLRQAGPAHRPDGPGRHPVAGPCCGFGPFEGNMVKAVLVSDFTRPGSRSTSAARMWSARPASKPYWFRLGARRGDCGRHGRVRPAHQGVCDSALDLKPNDFVALSAGKKARRPKDGRRAGKDWRGALAARSLGQGAL